MFLHTKGNGDVQCTLCTPLHLYTDSVNLFSSTFEFKMAGYKVTSLLRCWGELPGRWLYKPHPGGLPCTYRSIFEVVTSISKKFISFTLKSERREGVDQLKPQKTNDAKLKGTNAWFEEKSETLLVSFSNEYTPSNTHTKSYYKLLWNYQGQCVEEEKEFRITFFPIKLFIFQ